MSKFIVSGMRTSNGICNCKRSGMSNGTYMTNTTSNGMSNGIARGNAEWHEHTKLYDKRQLYAKLNEQGHSSGVWTVEARISRNQNQNQSMCEKECISFCVYVSVSVYVCGGYMRERER